jgi:DNA-binding response OmpR family regulator
MESILVIVADDEPAMNELVTRHLKAMNKIKVEVVQAYDGAQAWGLVRKHHPDLVVLDVMMPEMSGWEVCRKIREDGDLEDTGVIMLTGIGETLNALTSPLYGADAYLDKPFQASELHQKVAQILAKRDAGASKASAKKGAVKPAKKAAAKPAKKAAAKPAATKNAAKPAATKNTAKPAKKAAAKKPAVKLVKKAAAKPAAKKPAAKKPAAKPAKKGAKGR